MDSLESHGGGASTRALAASHFANDRVLVRGWYAVARGRDLGRERAMGVLLGPWRIALWRDGSGAVRAFDAVCPHLGGDLGQGRVVDGCLACPFHGWRFDQTGACRAAPGHATPLRRYAATWPATQAWGLIFVFAGSEPTYRLPEEPPVPGGGRWWWLAPPARTIACHPHLVVGNGLDVTHFDALHGMEISAQPIVEQTDPVSVRVKLRGRPRARWLEWLSGAADAEIEWSFTTIGPSLAWAHITSPVEFHALFTGRPAAGGGTATQVVLLLPRRPAKAFRAFVGLYAQLHDDRRILESVRFHPGFTATDEPLRRFAAVIDSMEAAPWPGGTRQE